MKELKHSAVWLVWPVWPVHHTGLTGVNQLAATVKPSV